MTAYLQGISFMIDSAVAPDRLYEGCGLGEWFSVEIQARADQICAA